MDRTTVYRIRVRGRLDPDWSSWFDGLAVVGAPDGDTVLVGPVRDQPALHGHLARIRDLGLELVSVRALGPDHQPQHESEV